MRDESDDFRHANIAATACLYRSWGMAFDMPPDFLGHIIDLFKAEAKTGCDFYRDGKCRHTVPGKVVKFPKLCWPSDCPLVAIHGDSFLNLADSLP
jgi:hypothetical protein